jgi:hypothetical protein
VKKPLTIPNGSLPSGFSSICQTDRMGDRNATCGFGWGNSATSEDRNDHALVARSLAFWRSAFRPS